MGYLSYLNNSENMLKILHRLPMHLLVRWAERANTIIETGREPTFVELAKFISDRAKAANTLYGVDLNPNSQTNTKYNKNQGDIDDAREITAV